MRGRSFAVAAIVATLSLPGPSSAEEKRLLMSGGGFWSTGRVPAITVTHFAVQAFHGVNGSGGTFIYGHVGKQPEAIFAECVAVIETTAFPQPTGYRWMIGGSTQSGSFRGTVVIGDSFQNDLMQFVPESEAPLCADPGYTGGFAVAGQTHTISL